MSETSFTAGQIQQVNAVYNANPGDPSVVWQTSASMGDQYAQAAYQGVGLPSTFFAKVIGSSNSISNISQDQMLSVEKSVVQGYINILNSSPQTNIGTTLLPTTTQIESNYYDALVNNGLPPSAAIDLSIQKIRDYLPDGQNWHTNFFGFGVNLDPSRVGPPSSVVDNIDMGSAVAHFFLALAHWLVLNKLVKYRDPYSAPVHSMKEKMLYSKQRRPSSKLLISSHLLAREILLIPHCESTRKL